MSSLALPAYLASAESTVSLQNTILEEATSSEDEMFATYLSKWQGIPGATLPSDSLPAKKSFWDTPGITQVTTRHLSDSGRVKAGCFSQSAVSGSLSSSQRGLVAGALYSIMWAQVR